MRANRFSPDRLGGSILCPAQRLRDRLPVAAVVGGLLWGGNRPIGPTDLVHAAIFHDGDLDRGRTQGETRTVTGLSLTNLDGAPAAIEVEQESDHEQVFAGTVQPGQTTSVTVAPLTQTWTVVGPGGRMGWDGLNVRWKIPA